MIGEITVKDLVEHLKTLPQNLPVAYQLHSESMLMMLDDIGVKKMQPARPDGWIHTYDKNASTVEYVLFPGN